MGKQPPLLARMLLIALVCCLSVSISGQQEEDDWIDPYDMINYDASTKTMRKPAEPTNYPNVPTKRREYTRDSSQPEQTSCDRQVMDLQAQVEEHRKRIKHISQQPTCNPVFKRFLSRLLKEIQRVGVPSDSTDILYDAKIRLSQQAINEIQALLEGEDSWRTGALDNAISQILVDLKPHDYEAWKWRFEDSFGVELDTVLKMGLFILVIVVIICTQLWSMVSSFMQFRRLFAVCFFVSIIWNWFYLYKIAFAEHQNNMAKMYGANEKCSGMKKIDWSDSLKEWFRSTWTLQDDPCKRYYEVLMVNPILLVPPTKAISVTITTFITEPLKHLGQGISEFLRALLKDLPITLQVPVLITIVLAIVVCMYGSVQAAFQHGITAPFRRRRRRDPELPQPERARRRLQGIEDFDDLAGGDQPRPRYQTNNNNRPNRTQVRQRLVNRARDERVEVETLRTAELPDSEDEIDAPPHEDEPNGAAAAAADEQTPAASAGNMGAEKTQPRTKPAEPDAAQTDIKPLKDNEKISKADPSKEDRATKSEDKQASVEDVTSSASLTESERLPVQESSAA